MDLAAYRTDAEAFLGEYGVAYHRHFAGLTDELPLDEIYDRHAALFSLDAVARLREQADAPALGDDDRRRLRLLLDFAVEGCLGLQTKAIDGELAQREASLEIEVGDTSIGFREAAVVQANEPDATRRGAIEAARLAATEAALNPLLREAREQTRAVVAELGWPSYRAMCEQLKGLDLDRLARSTGAFTAATEGAWETLVGPAVARTVGVGLDRLTRADLPWLFRFREADAHFPPERLMESFVATLDGLGIDLAAQPNVDVDVEQRPGKSPRAFVVAVRVPQDVRLVVPPIGGRDDYTALLHEGGHLEHFASVDPALPFEYRHLGDNAVTEAFAFLFDHLVENGEWLRRRLGVEDEDGALAAHARASRLVYLRRYGAKLAYELIAHAETPPDDAALADAYARELSAAVHVPWPTATYLSDLDPGFYVAAYLRAWALETHLRAWLAGRFGPAWFAEPEAGAALRELWRDGQRLSAEELLGELTGAELDFGVLLADLGLAT